MNRAAFTAADREPDPELLLRGYERAALTLNFVRALVDGGFADLHHPEYWDLGFLQHAKLRDAYRQIVDSISDSLDFYRGDLRLAGARGRRRRGSTRATRDCTCSYEQAQTRYLKRRQRWYNLSTHMPWIGMRTARPGGAHVEYFRGIANPIGVKVGEGTDAATLAELVRILNPDERARAPDADPSLRRDPHRAALPPMIQAVRDTGPPGAVDLRPDARQHRDDAAGHQDAPVRQHPRGARVGFRIHDESGSHLGGVHFELTGEDVTECTGGARGLTDADLARAYHTTVDPRLNYEQALELAMLIGRQGSRTECHGYQRVTSGISGTFEHDDGTATVRPRPRARC